MVSKHAHILNGLIMKLSTTIIHVIGSFGITNMCKNIYISVFKKLALGRAWQTYILCTASSILSGSLYTAPYP